MANAVYSRIDKFGRIVIPSSWRKHMSKKVVLIRYLNKIIVREEKDYLSEISGKIKFTDDELRNIEVLKAKGVLNERCDS